jgi:group II intron reverse transcriptase/maturase
VADRVAQMVVSRLLEPALEREFHPNSYGYRPGRSAHDALAAARQQCWRCDWVLDVDIKGFFDNIDHELLMKAIRKHTDCPWALLYIERWLKAPMQQEDGTLQARGKGTPQGGVISPLLANLFLHYAFDAWMMRNYSVVQFERYADDIVIHCKSLKQAEMLRDKLKKRLTECRLEMHPEKTKIVYCKDAKRSGDYPHITFDFLGYTFKPRKARDKQGQYFLNFLPAISRKSAKSIRQSMRDWNLHRRTAMTLDEIAGTFNPILRGWINYYSRFYRSELYLVMQHFDYRLAKWMAGKYKRVGKSISKASDWLRRIYRSQPQLFAHWALIRTA